MEVLLMAEVSSGNKKIIVCYNGHEVEAFCKRDSAGSFIELFYYNENNNRVNLLNNCVVGNCPAVVPAVGNTNIAGFVCDNGFTRPTTRTVNNSGAVVAEVYKNSAGSWVNVPPSLPATMKYGECKSNPHVKQMTNVTLAAGLNTITHNLALVNPKVTFNAWDTATGEPVMLSIGSIFTANTFQIKNVTVAITVDLVVIGEG
jgi:hypothetical protein